MHGPEPCVCGTEHSSLELEHDQQKKTNKQNITRDIVVKNNLTIARGNWGGDSGERGFQELL